MVRIIAVVILSLSMALPAHAQPYPQGGPQAETTGKAGPRKQLATIIFAGLAGAILGLSTLSFYGRPQDRLSNIAIGFAVGVIIGTGYTTYQAATRPYEFYNSSYDLYDRPILDRDFGVSPMPPQGGSTGLATQWSF